MRETGNNGINAISVIVSKNGYATTLLENGVRSSSGWMGSDRFFTAPEFQRRYDEVAVSLLTRKFTLVPGQFFEPSAARSLLAEVADIEDSDAVDFVEISRLKAVLVYSNSLGETFSKVVADTVLKTDGQRTRVYPEIYYMLSSLWEIPEYNKVIASFSDGCLNLAIAYGGTLQLCNSFAASDFTTAEYFIFLAMKRLQLNPEVTTIYFRTPLSDVEEMSMYRYFKSVDRI